MTRKEMANEIQSHIYEHKCAESCLAILYEDGWKIASQIPLKDIDYIGLTIREHIGQLPAGDSHKSQSNHGHIRTGTATSRQTESKTEAKPKGV